MTAMTDTNPTLPAPRPFRLMMLLPTLIVDGLLPIGIFKGLEAMGVAPVWALAAGCAPPVLSNLHAWLKSRRLDPIGLLIIASMGGGVAASIISGDIGSRIVSDALLNGAWGAAFLISLFVGKPIIFYLIRAVVAGDDASRMQAWNGLWRYAAFRTAMRFISATWCAVYFAEVLIELGLAHALTANTVLTIAPLMNLGGTVALLVFTRMRMRTIRERLELFEHLRWPL
jgi:hypothetical protein